MSRDSVRASKEDIVNMKKSQDALAIEEITKVIDCTESGLLCVPASISRCECLCELRLSQNQITSIPDSLLTLSTLRILQLDSNCISRLPKDLSGWSTLEELRLNHNRIKTLPASISNLTKLRRFLINNNKIKSLPDEIGALRRLEKLNISHNLIEKLPESLGSVSRLKNLIISHNKLVDFPMEAPWKALKHLEIPYNSFPHAITVSLKYFGQIRKINIIMEDVEGLDVVRNSFQIVPSKEKRGDTFTHEDTRDDDFVTPFTSPRKKTKLTIKRHKRGGSDVSDLSELPSPRENFTKKILKTKSKKDSSPVVLNLPFPQILLSDSLKFSDDSLLPLSGTLDQLLGLLIFDHSSCDIVEFRKEFVLVYPSIINDEKLINFLINSFKSGPVITKKRVIDVLLLIVTYHKSRFIDDSGGNSLHNMLVEFITENCNNKEFSKELLSILGFLNDGIGKTLFEESDVSIAELSPKDVAKQLCAIEIRLFKQIKLHDLVDKRFEKGLSPAMNNCSEWFQSLGAYVTSCILLTGAVGTRSALIDRFVAIAHKCLEFKNFNTTMSIFSALQNPAIQRLKATWREVSMKALSQYNELTNFFSVDNNFRTYRNVLKNTTPPCIPVLSLLQHDLIFIEEANDKYVTDDVINFERCTLLAKAMQEIYTLQQSNYLYPEFKDVCEQFCNITRLNSKVLYNLSNLLEPREAVKDIPAPVISKRKQLLQLGSREQRNQAAERAAKELINAPSKPLEAPGTPKLTKSNSRNNSPMLRSRSFSTESKACEVRAEIEKIRKGKIAGSFIATPPLPKFERKRSTTLEEILVSAESSHSSPRKSRLRSPISPKDVELLDTKVTPTIVVSKHTGRHRSKKSPRSKASTPQLPKRSPVSPRLHKSCAPRLDRSLEKAPKVKPKLKATARNRLYTSIADTQKKSSDAIHDPSHTKRNDTPIPLRKARSFGNSQCDTHDEVTNIILEMKKERSSPENE